MTTWATLSDTDLSTGKRITQTMMRTIRDNMRAVTEDDPSVPAADCLKRAGGQHRIVIGLPAFADDTVCRLQAYGNGETPLRSHNSGAGGGPASSGSMQTQAAHAGRFSVGTAALDVGIRASGSVWLQAGLMSALGTRYDIELNPSGGAVIIGADPGGSEAFRIGSTTVIGTDPGGSGPLRVGGSVSIRVPMTWPAANAAGTLTNDGSGGLSWTAAGSALAAFWAKVNSATEVDISAAGSATLNRMHNIAGTSASYDITISGLSPSAGDVLGFRVKDYTAANRTYRLDAGGTVKISGRTRYMTLVHTNVLLLMYDGADWVPLACCLDTPWVLNTVTDSGKVQISAVTTPPVKGTTDRDEVYWRRVGKNIEAQYYYRQTAIASATAGSGSYLFSIPIGAIDTTVVKVEAGAPTDPTKATAAGYGWFRCRNGAQTSPDPFTVWPYNTTQFRLTSASTTVDGGDRHLNNASTTYTGNLSIPLTDW